MKICPLHLPYSPTDMQKETYPLKKDTREHKKWELSKEPVSYTHLDVYKRQIISIIQKVNLNFLQYDSDGIVYQVT